MKPKVLLVDDSQPMREILKMMLADAAVVVGECGDGAEALDAYTRLQPDWVLMDVDMKDVDGIAATRQIIAAYPQAQVMIVTDHDDRELRHAALEAGALRYVVKEDLLSILEILKT
ncbi:MAG TPA: response regulator transcription factor [Pyrinomonadaceae bacterium]